MIIAGIGCGKGVSADEVLAAIRATLIAHRVDLADLSALATIAFKQDEAAIFAAGKALNLMVIVSDAPSPSQLRHDTPTLVPKGEDTSAASASAHPHALPAALDARNIRSLTITHSAASFAIAGTPSVSESAALAAAGPAARLLGPRIAVGRVTCALATSEPTR